MDACTYVAAFMLCLGTVIMRILRPDRPPGLLVPHRLRRAAKTRPEKVIYLHINMYVHLPIHIYMKGPPAM